MLSTVFLIILALLPMKEVSPLSGYLFKDEHLRTHPSIAQTDRVPSNCLLNLQSNSRANQNHFVYSGNGFNYDLGCSVKDTNSKVGDKYYVIDLVVYGSNKRVAKAWREQFMSSTTSTGKSISLDKKMSFYLLGYSNVICSVSKYNSFTNKFTKICQTNQAVFVEENPSAPSRKPIRKIFKSMKKSLTTTTTTTTKLPEIVDEKKEIFKPNTIEDQTEVQVVNNTSADSLNVRAMQYRDLFKAAAADKSKLLQLDEMNSKKPGHAIIQPIVLVLVFVSIFGLSVGTLAYLTYNQRLTQAYHTVNIDQTNQAGNDVTLKKFSKRSKSMVSEMEELSKSSEA